MHLSDPAAAALLDAPWQPDPYALYARLRAQHPGGVFRDEASRLWVACTAAAVGAALHDPTLRVRPADEPVPRAFAGSPAGTLFGSLMRQNDGPAHHQGKAWALSVLGAHLPVADAVNAVVERAASPRLRALDELMFEAPVQVLWRLLDGADDAGELPFQVRAVVTGWSALAGDADRAAGSAAASALLQRLGNDANRVGLFTQTCEATAGLIGSVLVAFQREAGLRARWLADASLDEAVANEVARHDAPVHNTRRFVVAATTLRGQPLERGEGVLLLLASANRDRALLADADSFVLRDPPGPAFSWGAGLHECPGARLARAIAMALLRAWHADSPELPALTSRWAWRRSPNARLPRFTTPTVGATP
jgi:cytochrome P450